MNIFKWITNRAGMATSTVLKAVGLTTVVGVAGVAALQFLDTPADNTAFNPAAQYDPGEVVYVAGGGAGAYASGGFSMDGYASERSGTSLNVSSAQINRLDRLTSSTPQADDVTEDNIAPSDPRAYQMGGSEGLGMNANVANEAELQNNPMAMMGNMMSNISNITQGVQGAAAGAAPAQDGTAAGTAPALASAQKNWSKGAATGGGAGGNSFNSSFVVQDSGKSSSKESNVSPEQAADMMKQFQGQMSSIHENTRMRAQSNFGNSDALLAGSWESTVANARNSKEANELNFVRKRSADAAANKFRAANEGSRAFLASTKISGGMRITGENITTGQGQGSADFDNENEVNLRGIKNWADAYALKEEQRKKDLANLKAWFWSALAVAIGAMIAIPFVKHIKLWGIPIVALAIALIATALLVVGFIKAYQYGKQYGHKGWPIAIEITLPILTVGVWASFIWSDAFMKFYDKVAGIFKTGGSAAGGTEAGAGGAGAGGAGGGGAGAGGAGGGGAGAGGAGGEAAGSIAGGTGTTAV